MKETLIPSIPGYELIDCGGGRKLERVAGVLLDRPAPQALWPRDMNISEWGAARAYFDRQEGGQGIWQTDFITPDNWQIQVGEITLELRPAAGGQIGLFPEQIPNWAWITERLKEAGRPIRLLNAFGYTGSATLAAAARDIEICHLDASKSVVLWARRNAELSGLGDRPIRWIVDDVLKFLNRELKRGQRYDAFILDPPAFGRGPRGSWHLDRDLPLMLEYIDQLLSDHPCFVVLSCHSPKLRATDLAVMLENLESFRGINAETLELIIPATKGSSLPSGVCGRIYRKQLESVCNVSQ